MPGISLAGREVQQMSKSVLHIDGRRAAPASLALLATLGHALKRRAEAERYARMVEAENEVLRQDRAEDQERERQRALVSTQRGEG